MSKVSYYNILVSDVERRIIIKALTLLKEQQIKEDKSYDFLDTLILRACNTPPLKKHSRSYEER